MEDLFYVNKYTLLYYLDLEELVGRIISFVFLVAKIWSLLLNLSQYLNDQMFILTLPVKVLATQYELAFSYYVLMVQIYESTGVWGVVFVTMTPIYSTIYLVHNVLLPSITQRYFPKYHEKHYSSNPSETTSTKKVSFFKKWFK